MKQALTKYILFSFLLLLTASYRLGAQVEMADQLRQSGKIYGVLAVILIIFIGIIIMMILLDRKIQKMESKINNTEKYKPNGE